MGARAGGRPMIDVPYLTETQIESRADALLDAFRRARRPIQRPPVPVDDELLYFRGLRLHMDDLHARFGVPRIAGRADILAALWIEDREIRVDESLDPEENPGSEGRYHFSIGHEIAHWELHRPHIIAAAAEPLLLVEHSSPIVCRHPGVQVPSSKQSHGTNQPREARARIERQANEFAACLLMPRALIRRMWSQRFANSDPVLVVDRPSVAPELRLSFPIAAGPLEAPANQFTCRDLEGIIADFAREFGASRQAMRIRLGKLGLIIP